MGRLQMKHPFATAFALGLGISTAAPAQAQMDLGSGLTLSLTPAASTDYLFRGVSQTRNRPAVSLTADLEHESGLYIGAFASNVAFLGTNARQEIDLLAGYRFSLGGVKLDAGVVWYTYPGYDAPNAGFELNYVEFALRANTTIDPVKLVGAVFYSPDFQLESGNATYVEGGADISLPFGITLSGRLGYQWIDRNDRFGTPNFMNYSVALSRELFAGVTLALGYYGTDIGQASCGGGQKICDDRFMATISRVF
jgi:uncharacterized protein (TIGR02001 family)